MNKLNKILIIIIVILVISLIISLVTCFKYLNIYKESVEKIMSLVERATEFDEYYNTNIESVKIDIDLSSTTSTGTTITITDNNKFPYFWKENYYIEKKEYDKWSQIELLSSPNFSEEIYNLDENNQIIQNIDWESIYGTLPSGTYRIIKYVYTQTSDIYFESPEFHI